MDYEKKYKEALNLAKSYYDKGCNEFLDTIFPELAESEDERTRKWLISLVQNTDTNHNNSELSENCKLALAYLEKQKEQKPVEPSDDELQRHQDELYDFKVFAAKQAKEHHISFVHDFEWNNFCEGLLSYFNERQKPAEWSEEDEEVMEDLYNFVISDFIQSHIHETRWKPWKTTLERNRQNRLKSLRPSWKPSEEQMCYLKKAYESYDFCDGERDALESLYNDLLNKLGVKEEPEYYQHFDPDC